MAGPFRAIVFDFDGTLTTLSEVPRHRIFPGFDSQQPDVQWLQEVAFGGVGRLELLLQTLDELRGRWGAELFVASFADRETIVRVLELLGGLHHFGEPPAARIFGWREMGGPMVRKGEFLQRLLGECGWRHEEVLFLDDQADNIRSARPICQAFWVRQARGLSMGDLQLLRTTGGAGLVEPSEQLGSEGGALRGGPADFASDATESGRSSPADLSLDGEGDAEALHCEGSGRASALHMV